MKNKNPLIDTVSKIVAKTTVDIDEKIDMENESPDNGENPDKKTRSKNTRPLVQTEDSTTSKRKSNSMNIHEIEKAWKTNKSKADSPEEIVSENIEMVKASIKSISKHALALESGLNETNQQSLSEGWVQSKITLIEDYLKAVHDYVMYYQEEEESDEEENGAEILVAQKKENKK